MLLLGIGDLMKSLKKFIASYNGRTLKVEAVSASKAIFTAAKVFCVKPNKVAVRES